MIITKTKNNKNVCYALILLLFSFIFLTAQKSTIFAEVPKSVRAIYGIVKVFENADANSKVILTLKYNEKATVIEDNVTIGVDNLNYYKIEIETEDYSSGYVLVSQVADSNIKSLQKKLDYNATIKEDCKTYNFDGVNYIETTNNLQNGTKIRIISGYDKKSEYTQIQFVNNNQEVETTFVNTFVIKTSGVSTTLIGAILIVITTASLFLIIFGIGKKKKNRNIHFK